MSQTRQPALKNGKEHLSLAFLARKINEKGWLGCGKSALNRSVSYVRRSWLGRLLPSATPDSVRCARFIQRINKKISPWAVNLGGGPRFCGIGWLNLDEVKSKDSSQSFHFSPNTTLPLPDGSVHTVYTSHAIEHLNQATVERLLAEARRVLRTNGRLVIKIPDFDRILNSWKQQEAEYFSNSQWGYVAVTYTWDHRGVADCLDNRAAMLFCGFWNDAYGDHFSGQINLNDEAYHGPAVVSRDYLRRLLNYSPSEISARLRAKVLEMETGFHFNHQNAWSRQELQELLARFGFYVLSFDPDTVIVGCADIPDITNMIKQSTYCLATRRS